MCHLTPQRAGAMEAAEEFFLSRRRQRFSDLMSLRVLRCNSHSVSRLSLRRCHGSKPAGEHAAPSMHHQCSLILARGFTSSPAYMATGVEANDEVTTSFSQFKLQKAPHNHRYIIYVIKDHQIVVEKTGEREKTWDDFMADLPGDDCRYAVVDVEFETDEGRPTSKIVFLSWAPETAKVRSKMVYAGSKDAIKRALVGVGIHLQATDQSELEWETVLPQVKKFT